MECMRSWRPTRDAASSGACSTVSRRLTRPPCVPPPGFPFCFKTCGLGLAALLVLVTLAAAELSMRLLLMSAQLTGKRSYEELARHAYGRAGQFAVDSCIIAMNVGSVVAYLNILTDTVSSVAGGGGWVRCGACGGMPAVGDAGRWEEPAWRPDPLTAPMGACRCPSHPGLQALSSPRAPSLRATRCWRW